MPADDDLGSYWSVTISDIADSIAPAAGPYGLPLEGTGWLS